MLIAAVWWGVWVAAIVFLFVCAAQNRRSGYRRPTARVSLLAEGWAWLEQIKTSMDAPDAVETVTEPVVVAAPDTTPDTTKEQLARLGRALDVNLAAPVSIGPQVENQAQPKAPHLEPTEVQHR